MTPHEKLMYECSARDIKEIVEMLKWVDWPTHGQPDTSALLTAAIEIWKHHNPFIDLSDPEESF